MVVTDVLDYCSGVLCQINRNKYLVFCVPFLIINKIKNTSTRNEDKSTTTALQNRTRAGNAISQSGSQDLSQRSANHSRRPNPALSRFLQAVI